MAADRSYIAENDRERGRLEGLVSRLDDAALLRKGDLVVFPQGMDCTWQVKRAVRKDDRFA